MNREEYLAEFRSLVDEMYDITCAKNADYTGMSDNPFKNFQAVEQMGVLTTEQGIFTRMTDKIMRVAGYLKRGELSVKDEKIEDTLQDLAVYSLILICYLRSKQSEPASPNHLSTTSLDLHVSDPPSQG